VGIEVLEEGFVVFGQAKEVIALGDLLGRFVMDRTSAFGVQVLLLFELLTALAIKPLIVLFEQRRRAGLGSARVIQAAEQLLDRQLVFLLGGADEFVVRDF